MSVWYRVFTILIFSSLVLSCSPAKFVGSEEYLLESVKVSIDDKRVNKSELKRSVRQKPNTRILGVSRFHLGLYNLSGQKDKSINRWLRKIGEPPTIYSPALTARSSDQIKLYLQNKGYYGATVDDTVFFKKRKAYVEYHIETGELTKIGDIFFKSRSAGRFEQWKARTGIQNMYYLDTLSTLLDSGMPLDMDILDSERERIALMLREKGYFNFSKNLVQYFADSTRLNNEKVANLFVRILGEQSDSNTYKRYYVRDIRIDMDFDPVLGVNRMDTIFNQMDYNGITITYRDKLKIRPKVITETLQINRMELYNVRQVLETYSRLQALNLFRFINIEFHEVEDDNNEGDVKALSCTIQLTPLKRQFYNIFVEGTHSSGNLGVGGNFTYNHRNLFRGGEEFSVTFHGFLRKENAGQGNIFNTHEIGGGVRLITPQFWIPFIKMEHFRRDFAPKTSMSLSYSYENTSFYTRSIANAKYGYLWRKANKRWRYNLDVIDLNYVAMKNVNSEFIDSLRNEYIKSAYMDHMIFSAVFSATFTDQMLDRQQLSYNYVRINLESSGNLLWGIDRISGRDRSRWEDGDPCYDWLGVRYSQFIKADAEYRFNWNINRVSSFVWRVFIGCGIPYGNMKVLPFEEAYFCGGANDLRAWHVRTLGPGSQFTPNEYPNSVGDFKLAANMEYRFKLFWLLEGALFVDSGNVWSINSKEYRDGAKLRMDFLKKIAIGTGAGLRLNANFFLLRFDLGVRVKDPSRSDGQFVLFNRHGGLKKSIFNIAIGYPF